MGEDSKEQPPSNQSSSDADKKPATAAVTTKPAVPAQSTPQPPRPAPVAPRPAATSAPAAPPKPAPKDTRRRNFLKGLFAVGAILSIVPFVPWGSFLSSSVETSAKRTLLQKVMIDDLTKYGPAAGQVVNVNDVTTFPPNDHWVITYPTSGDATIDAQNPDTFLKWELIRLPTELGGGSKKATDFVAYSKVCVHLWCSPNYNPTQNSNPSENGYQSGAQTHQQYECPCHGSIYQLPQKVGTTDALIDGGKAVRGPAALQPAPNNAIPMLTLMADSAGILYVMYPNADPKTTTVTGGVPSLGPVDSIEADGEIGFGRDFASYQNFLVPSAQLPADPAWAKVVVK